jgi:MoaA/NifB/PqqE/SkfB family radical SAM enzyme
MHINSQGDVEPCPFAHFASDNVRREGLKEIFRSEFLARLRRSDAMYRRGQVGCALLENMKTVEEIAAACGATRTDRPG